MKSGNHYKMTIEELRIKGSSECTVFEHEFISHENLLEKIEFAKNSQLLESEDDLIEMIIGIRLLGEVMLKNRKAPLFAELLPAFKSFMKNLKQLAKDEQ